MLQPEAMVRLAILFTAVCLTASACGSEGTAPTPSPTNASPTATAASTVSPEPTFAPTGTATQPAPSPTATNTAAPTPSPTTPAPTATTAPAPGIVVEHGDRTSNEVALTFDMGGRVDPALDIMDWLIAHNVAATVFMTGAMADNVNTDAGREVLALIDAHRAQFTLGNHSYSHPDFRDLTPAEMASELSRTETAIARYTSVSPRPFFRPPYGGQNPAVVQAVAAAGYTRTILWDVDTIDWEPESDGGPTTDQIVSKVLTNARGGSIVLMHLGGYNTFDALPRIVAGLQEKGFKLVNLGTLLAP